MATRRSTGYKKIVDEEAIRREICAKAYEKAKNKKWDLTQEDFILDENNNFTHATWKGVFCKGGTTVVATMEIINRYIDECNKPYGERDLSFIHLVEY
jgi:hypothetical protein